MHMKKSIYLLIREKQNFVTVAALMFIVYNVYSFQAKDESLQNGYYGGATCSSVVNLSFTHNL